MLIYPDAAPSFSTTEAGTGLIHRDLSLVPRSKTLLAPSGENAPMTIKCVPQPSCARALWLKSSERHWSESTAEVLRLRATKLPLSQDKVVRALRSG